MGAVTFSLDTRLVERLKQALPLSLLVETGTFKGDTVAALLPHVERVVTIEQSEALWRESAARFANDARVQVIHGDSGAELARVMPSIAGQAALFWLDAHWCVADHTSGEHSQCPLLAEINAIGRLGESSVVLIDDARLFLAPPPEPHDVTQWPSFDAIVRALQKLSERHEVMVVNDVIAFFPPAARAAVTGFAREHGVDWLRARQSLEENDLLRQALEDMRASAVEKEGVLHELNAALIESRRERDATVAAKEQDLHASQKAVLEKEAAMERLTAQLEHVTAQIEPLRAQVEQKEAALAQATAELIAKERVIQGQQRVLEPLLAVQRGSRRALASLGVLGAPLRIAGAAGRDLRRMLRPRLGVLFQHPPMPLVAPKAVTASRTDLPRISLVTPSFKQAHFIGRTIESVLAQGYPNVEYFVQDGASPDDTVEVLRRYQGRIAGWDSSPDTGQSQAINRGFARTSGEIMGWLNSDDILLPGALAAVGTFFAEHPEVDVVYGHRVLIDENDAEIGRWIMPPHSDDVLSWADFVPQETLFWRRRIWDKAGGRIDESFRFAMDWDLIVRFRDAGARFDRLPRFLGGFRIHPHQKTSAVINEVGFQEMNRIRERALGRVPSPMEVKRAVAPYLLRHLWTDLAWRARKRLGAEP